MPDFLYIVRPARPEMLTQGPTEREIEIVGRHFAYLKDLHQKGIVVLVGRTQENNETTLGICVYRADSEAVAQSILDNDPAVNEGVMLGELRPFMIALGP